jgi:copper(I)-binding protein
VDVKAVSGHSALVRRASVVAVLGVAALGLSSCAVGQHAATATDRPAIAGTGASVGSIDLQDISLQAPEITTRATGAKFYATGDDAPMTLVIVNDGHSPDTLTGITSTAFTSWGIVSTDALTQPDAIKGGATSVTVGANESVGLGLTDLGVGIGSSDRTLVLHTLAAKSSPLYPGSNVNLTFTFAHAGSVTVAVPVDLTSTPDDASIPAPPSGD